MFDDDTRSPIGNVRVRRNTTPVDRLPEGPQPGPARKASDLDTPEAIDLHARLMSFHRRELDRQGQNRHEMAVDADFYDNIQWSEEDARTLRERGQEPIVYNVISSTVNWVIGSEKRGRSDFRVLPRRKDDGKAAERKTELLKYLSDVNRSPFHKSRAFEDAVKVGIGWLECGVQDDDDGEPVYDRYESWRNMLWDSACTEKDLSDCRYVIRSKWVDLDIALAMFPDRRGVIEADAVDSDQIILDDDHGDEAADAGEQVEFTTETSVNRHRRRRVRLIEIWFRKPVARKRMSGGDFAGEVFDPTSPSHAGALEAGQSVLSERTMMRVHVAIATVGGLLYMSESPYRHNRFPFTPVWCFRRDRDGLPYGMIRGMRGMQDDINKRASKALAILSSNKVVMDEGAVDDLDDFAEEVSRPNAILVKKAGKELVLSADRELAPAHLELMSRSIQMIQSQSGVTDELMGRTTNAKSGIAIQARQEQGSLATAGVFDNLRFANQVHGEKSLSLVEQYFTETKQFRITNARGAPTYITINDGLPENDITRTKADFIISEQDWRASVRAAQVDQLLEMFAKLAPGAPQLALVMMDLIVESMDVPFRDELVARIRKVTGMSDPDAEEPSPEEVAAAQAQAEQAAMQKALMQAQIAEKQASAEQKVAAAAKTQADARAVLASLAGSNVAAQKAALEAAMLMLSAPPAVPVADRLLHESEFVSRSDREAREANDVAVAQAAQDMQREQEMQAQQQPDSQQPTPTQAPAQRQPM